MLKKNSRQNNNRCKFICWAVLLDSLDKIIVFFLHYYNFWKVSNYFTSRRGVVLNLFNGAIDSSSATALILASIYSFIGYQFTWALYCLVGFFVLSRTIFILPKQHIPQVHSLTKNYSIKIKETDLTIENFHDKTINAK